MRNQNGGKSAYQKVEWQFSLYLTLKSGGQNIVNSSSVLLGFLGCQLIESLVDVVELALQNDLLFMTEYYSKEHAT